MPSEGGCLCGAIRYRIEGAPLSSIVCHCATCRRASGGSTVAWLTVNRARFEILSGSPSAFGGTCGTALTYENTKNPTTIDITTSSLDDPNQFPPTEEVWLEHKLSWQSTDAGRRHNMLG
jgi:hypothetical protein